MSALCIWSCMRWNNQVWGAFTIGVRKAQVDDQYWVSDYGGKTGDSSKQNTVRNKPCWPEQFYPYRSYVQWRRSSCAWRGPQISCASQTLDSCHIQAKLAFEHSAIGELVGCFPGKERTNVWTGWLPRLTRHHGQEELIWTRKHAEHPLRRTKWLLRYGRVCLLQQ